MKTFLTVLGAIALAALLLAAGTWLGATQIFGQGAAGTVSANTLRPGLVANWGGTSAGPAGAACHDDSTGEGIVGSGFGAMPCGAGVGGATVPEGSKTISIDEAKANVERYLERLGDDGLQITEIMEFERNFYAIVAEKGTGTGAMELLVDKVTGAVGPEMGPNMMWNAKYGTGCGMMGRTASSGEMSLSPELATEAAQRWLNANLPGREPGDADPFYGYYTFHFLQDGQIEGMLSVNGSSGEVWYHNWHGSFVSMLEEGSQS
jgi:hypothetical protein